MPLNSSDVVLVTGGAGFLGQHIVRQLVETAVKEIRVFDSKQISFEDTGNIVDSLVSECGMVPSR